MSFLKLIYSKLFGAPKPTIIFKSYTGDFSVSTPVTPTRQIKSDWMRAQDGPARFPSCPGMLDYANAGYIITAHTDIHIKANKAGVIVTIHPTAGDNGLLSPQRFDFAIVDGMVKIGDIKKHAGKVPLPWHVQAKPGYSAYVMPATMHATYFDKIFVYPGIVDFDRFHTVNFVFSPIIECEFTIYAGTPLLQVIPFKRESVSAECGKATETEADKYRFNIPSRMKHYYRRFLQSKKPYTMKCPYEHRTSK